MGKQLEKDNLEWYGEDFQFKLAKYFIEDSKYFSEIASIVNPNYFTHPLLRTFVGELKDYYQKENTVPSYAVMGILLRQRSNTETDIAEWSALIEKLKKEISFEGFSFIKENALKFFKQQYYIKIAKKIVEIAKTGNIDHYDECKRLFDEAVLIGNEDDLGHSLYELKEKALSSDYTISIPTGISKLDEVLGGGLDKGKLGLIIAPAGFGKTSFTTAIDSYAATYRSPLNNNEGFKVLQIYFEDDDVDITRKHFSRITQTEARNFKRLDYTAKEEINEWLENFKDKDILNQNLRIKSFKTGEKSASDIEIFLRRLINSGFRPDLVSIDYFECLAPEKGYQGESEWAREGVTMRKLESLAKELDIAIWVPTQGNKDSINSPEVIRMDQAGGSVKKIHVAQLIISIARRLEDIDKNLATIAILKNRSGKSGKVFSNIKFDNGTSTISCDDTLEYDNQLAWEEDSKRIVEEKKNEMIRSIAKRDLANRREAKFKAEFGNAEPF